MQSLIGKTNAIHDKVLLQVVADEHCISILQCLDGEPKPVTQIRTELGISIGKAYRKLKLLQKSGLLDTTFQIRPDGKKFFLYRSAVRNFAILFAGNKLEISADFKRDGRDLEGKNFTSLEQNNAGGGQATFFD